MMVFSLSASSVQQISKRKDKCGLLCTTIGVTVNIFLCSGLPYMFQKRPFLGFHSELDYQYKPS